MPTKSLYVTNYQFAKFEQRMTNTFSDALNEGMSVIGENFMKLEQDVELLKSDVKELKVSLHRIEAKFDAKFDIIIGVLTKKI